MERETQSALGYMARETGAITSDEINRLVNAVTIASREFPDHFMDNPKTRSEKLKRDIFVLKATTLYFTGHAPQEHINRLHGKLGDLRIKLNRIVG